MVITALALASMFATVDPAPKGVGADAEFDVIRQVLQHPRCQNCHIPGDQPLQFDAGVPHAMSVRRGADGKGAPGLPCSTCHGTHNLSTSYGSHVPPGAPGWHLPPADRRMVFIGLGARELCERLKDPAQNNGKDLNALLEHVDHDPLVLWGWSPGAGRAAVDVPHDRFVSAFKAWVEGGGRCP
jgi:hypothetical protein